MGNCTISDNQSDTFYGYQNVKDDRIVSPRKKKLSRNLLSAKGDSTLTEDISFTPGSFRKRDKLEYEESEDDSDSELEENFRMTSSFANENKKELSKKSDIFSMLTGTLERWSSIKGANQFKQTLDANEIKLFEDLLKESEGRAKTKFEDIDDDSERGSISDKYKFSFNEQYYQQDDDQHSGMRRKSGCQNGAQNQNSELVDESPEMSRFNRISTFLRQSLANSLGKRKEEFFDLDESEE